jgi:hypothetical protein
MTDSTQAPAKVRGKKLALIIVGVGIVASLVVSGFVGGCVYRRLALHNMAGLQGTWRDINNPKHLYEFQPNGDVDAWTGSKSWLNRIGWTATWRRDGQNITIHTDRNWDLQGTLEGDAIRGKMIMRDGNSETQSEAEIEWRRE